MHYAEYAKYNIQKATFGHVGLSFAFLFFVLFLVNLFCIGVFSFFLCFSDVFLKLLDFLFFFQFFFLHIEKKSLYYFFFFPFFSFYRFLFFLDSLVNHTLSLVFQIFLGTFFFGHFRLVLIVLGISDFFLIP